MRDLDVSALVLDPEAYADRRKDELSRLVPIRRARRVIVGPLVSFEFENAETLLHQVQEMVFAERVRQESAAAEELATYRRLLPSQDGFCATMFVELRESASARRDLNELDGLQNSVRLQVGDAVIVGEDVPPDDPDETTYSVHFLRFAVDADQRRVLGDLTQPAVLRIEHPKYEAEAPLPAELRAQLLADLSEA